MRDMRHYVYSDEEFRPPFPERFVEVIAACMQVCVHDVCTVIVIQSCPDITKLVENVWTTDTNRMQAQAVFEEMEQIRRLRV